MNAPRPRSSGRLGSLIALVGFLVACGVLFANRKALLRSSGSSRSLTAEAPAAVSAESGPGAAKVDPDNVPRPNCGISLSGTEKGECAKSQAATFASMTGKTEKDDKFTGIAGYERTLGNLFNRYDGKIYFPRGRPITLLQVGGSNVLDRYGSLGRGPRLDDRIVLVEANKETARRLAGRIRMDQRLMLFHGAAWEEDTTAWFAYDKVPNYANNNGKVTTVMPTNISDPTLGEVIEAQTLNTIFRKITGPIDVIMSDADGSEPYIFKGALETLKRTRIAIFSCNQAWASKGPSYSLASIIKDVFEPAGMVVALLGDGHNIILSHGLAPSGFNFEKDIPKWGFCLAVHTAPPIIRNLDEISRLVLGVDEPLGACAKGISGTGPSSWCKEGLLDTLGGIDTPIVKSEYEMPYY
jgi:hypothetical protein